MMMRRVAGFPLFRWIVIAALAAAGAAASAQNAAERGAPPPPPAAFDLLEFEIEGNTVLPVTAIERAVYPHLGQGRSVDDVQRAVADLRRAYAEAGYPLVDVQIPEQQVVGGVVRLLVVEAKVANVRVTGARYYSQGWIRSRTPALREGETVFAPDVQEQLAELNRTEDRRVLPVLKPGPLPGTTDVELQVQDRLPLHGSLELNNRYSANTSELRLNAALRYDNLFQREHSIGLQFQTSPLDTDEVKAIVGTYTMPIPGRSTTLSAYYLYSDSNVATVGGFAVAGRSNIFGLRVTQPLPGPGAWSSFLVGGLDRKDVEENLDSGAGDPLVTPIVYWPLTVQYAAQRAAGDNLTALTAGLSFNLREIGGDPTEFADKRFQAGSNFVVFRWDAQHTHALPGDFAAYGRFDGQVADQPLVSNEQYFAGGFLNVRGYLEAEVLGDDAVHGTVELRTPSFAGRIDERVSEARALVFVDGARLRIRKPLPEQEDRFTLLSAGAGLRLRVGGWSSLSLAVGWPLRDTVNTRSGNPRLQFSAALEM